ncbi:carboxylesterase/lipase family protein [Nevskia soli]|uniref:carboxylesterase/lipase family protein n=1 Tax=Nevskia soli TaxID=418856 RepID=UPI0015D90AAD|nr:carboxylesterase family protein [Nevskia soli]
MKSIFAFLCAISCFAASADTVRIDSGSLRGAVSGNVTAFKGVPFAAPPIGANRWRPPQPVAHWSGVRDATQYGADCAQLPFPSDAAPLGTKPSENCLFVNVWTPAAHGSAKLPVMVWIYGGGYVNGGSSPAVYDGTQFAAKGVVFVSFNYRVGRFGFFAHPALTAENPDGLLGNYAFMDQIAALQWVKRNIAAFGGDPGKVTLFGESAGGGSVLTMLTTPLAHGLFQKAIIESGGGRSGVFLMPPVHATDPDKPSGENNGLAFAKQAGITGTGADALAKLRALPEDQIVKGLNMATMFGQTAIYSGPMIDGKLVVETPEEAILAGHEMKVPVIAGANSADIGFSFANTMDAVFQPFGADREKAAAAYNASGSTDVKAIGSLVAMDKMMVEPARFVVQQMTLAGQPAFEYRFSYVAESMRKEWKGAPHATEIPFVFDTVKARYGEDLTASDESTARAANAYWVAFAKTGDPAPAGLPKWPKYDPKADLLLNFAETGPMVEADPWKTRLDLVEKSVTGSK